MSFQISHSNQPNRKKPSPAKIKSKKLAKKQHKKLKKILIWVTVIGLIGLLLYSIYTYFYYSRVIASPERLMGNNHTGLVLNDKDGKPFYTAYEANRSEVVDHDQIPEVFRQAVVASEDKGFYEHGGYSIRSILAAFVANIFQGGESNYGGSTITQQLVKNSLLSTKKSYSRKYQELILSIAVDRRYTKDQVLDMYINSVFFGENSFGVQAASETYFNKPASKLTLAESAMLVGVMPAPSAYSPISGDPDKAKERQEYVLKEMQQVGYITKTQEKQALTQTLKYNQQSTITQQKAPHFAQMVIDELLKKYNESELAKSGFVITTTLNMDWQNKAQTVVKDQVAQLAWANATNGAATAIEPSTGKIRMAVGSVDWNNPDFGQVNMVTSPRQPGSTFKPIYYTGALDQGLVTPATIMHDVPTSFSGYTPKDFDRQYRGNISIRRSLANSLNIPSVELMEKMGTDNALKVANDLGLGIETGGDYGLPLALGTAEVPLYKMTNAYATFANRGVYNKPTTIEKIVNKYDQVEYSYSPDEQRVISPAAAYLISSILSDEGSRDILGNAMAISRPAAVKTGTTEDIVDTLAIGYTNEVALGVWVGNNNNEELTGVYSSTAAGPIWRTLMEQYLEGKPVTNFEQPDDVEKLLICFGTELRSANSGTNTYYEYFMQSAVPTGFCTATKKVEDKPKKSTNKSNSTSSNTPTDSSTDTATDNSTTDPTDTGGGTTPTTDLTIP